MSCDSDASDTKVYPTPPDSTSSPPSQRLHSPPSLSTDSSFSLDPHIEAIFKYIIEIKTWGVRADEPALTEFPLRLDLLDRFYEVIEEQSFVDFFHTKLKTHYDFTKEKLCIQMSDTAHDSTLHEQGKKIGDDFEAKAKAVDDEFFSLVKGPKRFYWITDYPVRLLKSNDDLRERIRKPDVLFGTKNLRWCIGVLIMARSQTHEDTEWEVYEYFTRCRLNIKWAITLETGIAGGKATVTLWNPQISLDENGDEVITAEDIKHLVLRDDDGIVSPEIDTWEISFTMKHYVAPQRWKAYANMPTNIYDRPVPFKARDLLDSVIQGEEDQDKFDTGGGEEAEVDDDMEDKRETKGGWTKRWPAKRKHRTGVEPPRKRTRSASDLILAPGL